jgi:hypothetical protein
MKNYIHDQIYKFNYRLNISIDTNKLWDLRAAKVWELLVALDPSPPLDGSNGYISFNVIDKDMKILDKPRVKITTPKFLVRKLGLKEFFNDKTIRKISDNINSKFYGEINIRLDKGKKITENYKNEVGGHSCMTGSYAHCTKLYEMNPNRFEQLVFIYANDSARAIVSKLDNGEKYCDRCYSTSRFLYAKLQEYSREQGWYQSADEDLIISGLNFQDGCVPYMDTFNHYKIVNNKLNIFYSTRVREYDGCLDTIVTMRKALIAQNVVIDF